MTRKMSVHVQYKCNFFPNTFDPWVIESMNAELIDTEGCLYATVQGRVLEKF
jgi:hypothetical protein